MKIKCDSCEKEKSLADFPAIVENEPEQEVLCLECLQSLQFFRALAMTGAVNDGMKDKGKTP